MAAVSTPGSPTRTVRTRTKPERRETRKHETRKRETTRVRTIARTSPCTTWTSPRTPARCSGRRPAPNRATRRARRAGSRAGMFRRVAPTYGAPASVCPRRASRRWTTSDGSAKTWTGCWRCTPLRWWTSRRSADRTCASSWRSARRARCAASLAHPPPAAKPGPAPPRPRRWTRASATARRARAIQRTKGQSRRIRRTKRRFRCAARAAARVAWASPAPFTPSCTRTRAATRCTRRRSRTCWFRAAPSP